jgi:D-alanyl-D-alanine dipeptidase
MSNHRTTNRELEQMFAEEFSNARNVQAERQRLSDAMRAAGFATPKPVLQGEVE